MDAFVVVSGLPASGKTSIAAFLAESLRLPLFDKDSFLEALFESEGVGPSPWRRSLSVQADALLQQAATAERAAILTSWWKHPASTVDSGTPIGWLSTPPRITVEVHCTCRPAVAAARFLARRRHPGHLDDRWSHERLLVMLEQQHALGPLFPDAITINTEQQVEMEALLRKVSVKANGGADA